MNTKYEMTRFDAESYPGTAIVRLRATALDSAGATVTYRKRIVVLVEGEPATAYEPAPVFSESERRLSYDGEDPATFGLGAAKTMKAELDERLSAALSAHGLLATAAPSAPRIDGPVELKL
ncbi:MAG: hypothetical protein ACRD1P_11535 [Thermoanaerobaculia bacterium]